MAIDSQVLAAYVAMIQAERIEQRKAERVEALRKAVGQPCWFCHGTGKVYAPKPRNCSVCHGTGRLPL